MRGLSSIVIVLVAAIFAGGCTSKHYRNASDKAAYRIIAEKQEKALGKTNAFSIDTPYSGRKPKEVAAQEIVDDRMREGAVLLTAQEALRIAFERSPEYQLRKERVFFEALNLSSERFAYIPQFTSFGSTVQTTRDSRGDQTLEVANRLTLQNALKTGGRITLNLANSFLRFYTSGRSRGVDADSAISLSLVQPLLRGAGARIAAERLTQAERDVIYEVRAFDYYQDTFAFSILSTYLGLVQQQDTVRNQYTNFVNRVSLRQRSEALAVDRLAPFQADLARQEELAARNSYILAVQRYRDSLDDFKVRIGLPAGFEIRLDENALAELEAVGLAPAFYTEQSAIKIALEKRLDLLNEIDTFEDAKRRIDIARDALNPELNLFTTASLGSVPPNGYASFNVNDYQLTSGLELDLPINRRVQRNAFRSSIVNFEAQLRTLATFLDTMKNDIRTDIRNLEQTRQSYEIQVAAKQLADRRVESSELSLQAGRIQVRDVVDAQAAKVQAYNAATAALVQYHLGRMRLLLDLGILDTTIEKFWLKAGESAKTGDNVTPPPAATSNELVTPDEVFKNERK